MPRIMKTACSKGVLLLLSCVLFAFQGCRSTRPYAFSGSPEAPLGNQQEYGCRSVVNSTDDLSICISDLSNQIINSMLAKEKKLVAITDFCDLAGQIPEFGRFVSEELTTQLFKSGRLNLVERRLLDKLMFELHANNTDLIDSKSAKKFGKISGADAIVSGTISDLGESIRINARLVETETGSIFAAADAQVRKIPAVEKLLLRYITLQTRPGARDTMPGQIVNPGENLIINGNFTESWTEGWTRKIGKNADGSNHIQIATDNGNNAVHLYHTGNSYVALVQIVPVSSERLRFSGNFKLDSRQDSSLALSAIAMVELSYLDNEKKRLGGTRFINSRKYAFTSNIMPVSSELVARDDPTLHYIFLDSSFNNYTLDIDEEILAHLPGVDPSEVKELAVVLYTGGADYSSSAELWANNLKLAYK